MTGENFKYFDRHNAKLEKMVEDYRAICDEQSNLYDTKIRYGEETPKELMRYNANECMLKSLGYRIWICAFYEYGRTNKAANDYCINNGILDF